MCEGPEEHNETPSVQGQVGVWGQFRVWQCLQDSGVAPSGVTWELSPLHLS